MANAGILPLGVCVLPERPNNAARTVSYPSYVHEILGHAGICYSTLAIEDLPDALPGLRLLLTVGETALDEDIAAKLRTWVQEGGAWLSVAGVCGLGDMFGVEVEPPACKSWGGGLGTLGEGYLTLEQAHPALGHLKIPLHYFNGIPVRAVGVTALAGTLDAHGRATSRAAMTEIRVGEGLCLLIAPDVTGTVVRIQQGVAVTRDGVPAPDGTAPNCDNVLKAGDGGVLDWLLDRQPVPGVPGLSAFLQPIADQWREILLRAIFHLAAKQGVPLPVLWLYPRDLPALGHISHDTDGNDPACALAMLEVVESAGINTTWCVLPPGYPAEVIGAIRAAGHELAMHYDAMSEGTEWSETEFDRQWRSLVELFGGDRPVSNKNHFLRWEGDTEFFEWCANRGIQVDESKGATKTGEIGFTFGACHPYFPVDPKGEIIDVLELPVLTQDLLIFAPEKAAEPLMAAALRSHGVLHLLFHPAHIKTAGVADVLLGVVEKVKGQGMEWWPACRINAWERARRKARWSDYSSTSDDASVRFSVADSLPGASIMWLTPADGQFSVNGVVRPSRIVERWGFEFRSVTFDAEQDGEYALGIAL